MKHGGEVVVTLPVRMHERRAAEFLRDKADWVASAVAKLKAAKEVPVPRRSRAHYLAHKEEARRAIEARVEHFAGEHGFSYSGVSIRNQKSRWASCSTTGALSFSYKLHFIEQRLLDYVVVHELCHLRHHNHSRLFWNAVESIMPDYRERRRELRAYRM